MLIFAIFLHVLSVKIDIIPPTGVPPSLIKSSCMIYNSSGIIYLFGGHQGTDKVLNDIFTYNIEKNFWSQSLPLSSTGPSERYGSGCFIRNNSLMVFGGTTNYGTENDLWAYDTVWSKWQVVEQSYKPSYRYFFASISYEFEGKFYFALYGGFKDFGISSGFYM